MKRIDQERRHFYMMNRLGFPDSKLCTLRVYRWRTAGEEGSTPPEGRM